MDFKKIDANTLEREEIKKETVTKESLLGWKLSLESQLKKCDEMLDLLK